MQSVEKLSVIHGVETKHQTNKKPFQSTYGIFSQNDNYMYFCIQICSFEKITHLFPTKFNKIKQNQER